MSYMEMQFPGDVGDARVRDGRNINDAERWGLIAAGVGLALYGLTKRGAAGWLMAGAGGLLVQRGVSGHCHTYQLLGVNTAGTGSDTRRGAVRFARSDRRGERHDRPACGRAIPLLAQPREPAAVHAPSRIDRARHRHALALARGGARGGTHVEWNAEIINEVPGKVIGWRSLEGSDVVSAGSVNFEEAGGSTRLRVRLQYSPPGGKMGDAVARLMGRDAATEIREDLQQLKQQVESGQVSTSDN